MNEESAKILGGCIILGLVLNGCLTAPKRQSIDLIGTREALILEDAIAEGACYLSGRDWDVPYGCKDRE